jgi:hypothetical protein
MESGVRFREARPADGGALAVALVEAVDWRGRGDLDLDGALAVPALAHYLTGWPRPGDFGTVAVDGEDVVGAAWGRLFPDDGPGYGPQLRVIIGMWLRDTPHVAVRCR